MLQNFLGHVGGMHSFLSVLSAFYIPSRIDKSGKGWNDMRLPQRHSCVRVTSQAIHSVNSCSNNTCRQPADRYDAASSEGRCVSTNNSCSLKKIIQGLNYCEVRDVEPALAGRWCK